jgi:hypothetical protein
MTSIIPIEGTVEQSALTVTGWSRGDDATFTERPAAGT